MDKQKIFKAIKKIIQNPLQLGLIVTIIVVLVVIASQITIFHSENKTKIMDTQTNVDINPTIDVKNDDKTLISANKKRVEEELKQEHKEAKNLNTTYLKKEYDTGKKNIQNNQQQNTKTNIETGISIDNPADNNVATDKKENKTNPNIQPKNPLDIQINNNDNANPFTNKPIHKKKNTIELKPTEDLTRDLAVPTQENKNYKKKEEDYYAQIASFSDDTTDDGGFKIINASMDSQTLNNKPINTTQNSNNSNNFVIKAGSKYYALLEIPINSIYANNVKPIAKIISGDLAGNVLIGNAVPTTNNMALILKFNRLVLPDGSEKGVNAVGVNINDVTPAFVDDIDRHLFPRIVFATLADMINNYNYKQTNTNFTTTQPNGVVTTGPAQSILGSMMAEIANSYKNEVKVNKQVFIVIFY